MSWTDRGVPVWAPPGVFSVDREPHCVVHPLATSPYCDRSHFVPGGDCPGTASLRAKGSLSHGLFDPGSRTVDLPAGPTQRWHNRTNALGHVRNHRSGLPRLGRPAIGRALVCTICRGDRPAHSGVRNDGPHRGGNRVIPIPVGAHPVHASSQRDARLPGGRNQLSAGSGPLLRPGRTHDPTGAGSCVSGNHTPAPSLGPLRRSGQFLPQRFPTGWHLPRRSGG